MTLAVFRKPWVIAGLLALVGITGAVVVNVTARKIHAEDRAAVVRFSQAPMRAIDRAVGVHAALGELVRSGLRLRDAELRRLRAELERSRTFLHETSIADILQPSAEDLLSALAYTLQALAYVEQAVQSGDLKVRGEDLRRFEQSWATAARRFERGKQRFDDLECRARTPGCVRR